jgi:hypothetical protein
MRKGKVADKGGEGTRGQRRCRGARAPGPAPTRRPEPRGPKPEATRRTAAVDLRLWLVHMVSTVRLPKNGQADVGSLQAKLPLFALATRIANRCTEN